MRKLPDTIKGFTAFVDGYGQGGVTTSGKLPVIKVKTEGHRDGGMDGESDLDLGIDKLEAELGFAELSPLLAGCVGTRNRPITLRGSQEGENGVKRAVIAEFRGLVTEADPGTWDGETKKTELKLKISCDYYRLRIGGQLVYEIDVLGGVRNIDGADQLALRRANLGL